MGGKTAGGLLPKTRVVFKEHLSFDHPSVSIVIQLFTSFPPLTFDLSHLFIFLLTAESEGEGETFAVSRKYTHVGA